MSVVIISAILVVIMFTLNTASFFARFDALDAENKRESLALAESCAQVAMLRLAQNPSYAPASGGDCVSLGGTCGGSDPQKVCRICAVTPGGAGFPKTIRTRARYNGAFTNLRVVIASPSAGSIAVADWTEQSAYGGPGCLVP